MVIALIPVPTAFVVRLVNGMVKMPPLNKSEIDMAGVRIIVLLAGIFLGLGASAQVDPISQQDSIILKQKAAMEEYFERRARAASIRDSLGIKPSVIMGSETPDSEPKPVILERPAPILNAEEPNRRPLQGKKEEPLTL
jgi:hypothetical protein